MSKTIREIADELGVSKTYIDKLIRKLDLNDKLETVGNKYLISKSQEKVIKSAFNGNKTQTNRKPKSPTNFAEKKVYQVLENELKIAHKQNETLQKLLDQQQQLTLQANQQIKQLQEQLLLTTETKEEKKSAVEEPVSEIESVSKTKWWAFWK